MEDVGGIAEFVPDGGIIVSLDELVVVRVFIGSQMIMVGVYVYFQRVVFPGIDRIINKVGIKDFSSDIKISVVIYRSEGCRIVGRSHKDSGY